MRDDEDVLGKVDFGFDLGGEVFGDFGHGCFLRGEHFCRFGEKMKEVWVGFLGRLRQNGRAGILDFKKENET